MKTIKHKALANKSLMQAGQIAIRRTRKGSKKFDQFSEKCNHYFPIKEWQLSEREIKDLFAEYLYYRFKYGFSVTDYFLYELYRKSEREIRMYMSEGDRIDLYHAADEKAFLHLFGNKRDFFDTFNEYMQKEILFVDENTSYEDFCRFTKDFSKAVIKPLEGERGEGVRILSVLNEEETSFAWQQCSKGNVAVEKVIIACDELSRFHPESLNTVRISTAVSKKGVPHILAASFRTGTGNHSVDNGHSDGVYAAIDTASGIITTIGYNLNGYRFPVHPDSGLAFAGTIIPEWEKLLMLNKEIAVKVPHMRYIGWDWALDQSYNWVLIEGNEPGGIDIHQHAENRGLLKKYRDILL